VAAYCINCGTAQKSGSVCPSCGLDPKVPAATIAARLERLQRDEIEQDRGLPESVAGEYPALLLSIALLLVGFTVAGLASLGVYPVIVALAIAGVRVSEVRQASSMRRVTETGMPLVYNAARTAAFRLDVPFCPLYVVFDDTPNAYTQGFWGQHAIVLHSKLLEVIAVDELVFVLGHELGHAKKEHVTLMILTSPRMFSLIRVPLQLLFNRWSLKAEYTADRAGLIACRSPDTAARALMKISFGVEPESVARAMEELSDVGSTPFGQLVELLGDHPLLKNRIRALARYYEELVAQGRLPAFVSDPGYSPRHQGAV
jgi:Zn-dependent protease with chaperone function